MIVSHIILYKTGTYPKVCILVYIAIAEKSNIGKSDVQILIVEMATDKWFDVNCQLKS